MRIIGNLPHAKLKITIFKMEHRLTLKFEDGMYEQAYKFSVADDLMTAEDVARLVTPQFVQRVEERFSAMRTDSVEILNAYWGGGDTYEEVII